MRIVQRLIGLYRRAIAKQEARGRTLAELAAALQASGATLETRLANIADTPAHREAIAHWVGIERWGQRRLRVALGEPFVWDEHHPYRPDVHAGMDALRQAFATTRAETLDLVRRLQREGVDPTFTVRHNDLGDLTVAAWLAYLRQHPDQEARAILKERVAG